jgi:hypothetical protein
MEREKKVSSEGKHREQAGGRHRSQQVTIEGGGHPTLSPIALLSKNIDKNCRKWPENAKKCKKPAYKL